MINLQQTSWSAILSAMDQGTTLVTANNRLAGAIRKSFEQAAINKGLEVWLTPDVLPWSAWLQRSWEESVVSGALPATKRLLTPQQEQCIWEDIVTRSLKDNPLQQITGTVRLAQQAWQLMQSWRLSLDEGAFHYNTDSAAFLKWASRFEARCKKNDWLPLASLPDELQRIIQSSSMSSPTELVLIGFDELSPQQQSLLQSLAASACGVRWLQLAGKQSRTARIGCLDLRQEATIVARWVRQRLDDNPHAEIGVVVPELASHRDILIHAFDDVLMPKALQPGHQSVARPYNISLGLPLSAYPLIGVALKLLCLLQPTISLDDTCRVLRSPFIAGWEPELGSRALLDKRLRETGELNVSLNTLRYHASQTDRSYACPLLAEMLDAWSKAARDCPHTDSPGHWSQHFARLLKAVGWASGRILSSEEYQVAEAWQQLLGAFASLEPVTEAMTASGALEHLRRLAREWIFQPQTNTASVQVLGLLEAGGLQFDDLWVMGLHDGVWPMSPQPNPFIPLGLQRDAGLPHCSEERQLEVFRATTRRLLTSAAEVIVSFPQRQGEEELRPSPLITDLPIVDQNDLGLTPFTPWRESVHLSARLTPMKEDPAPSLKVQEVKGGSAVFKLQAACPFRAFAELRLGARPLGQADIGLDAMTRGSLIHSILERVWDRLSSHAQLIATDTTDLDTLVHTLVAEVINQIADRYPQTFSKRFRRIEAERLCRQVLEWLQLEKQRQPFRVIAKEGKYQATAGGLSVQLQIDRIDELTDGRQVVIDYKTGEVKPSQWFGERPDEPQLPLYSMAIGGDIAGVLFAQIKAGGMAFIGVAEEEDLVPGVKSYKKLRQTRDADSWSEVLHDWQAKMEGLGEAFRNGEALVDPKRYPETCTYCELTPLCRINELTVLEEESSDTEDQP